MSVQITTLIENTKGEHLALINEHGISFYIEKDGHKLLFDTGQSANFIRNAQEMRIDLSDLEYVVLSHGHYDHSGGLKSLTEHAKNFSLVLGTGFFQEKYAYRNNSYEFLGNNFDEKFLKEKGIPYRFVSESLNEIMPGVYVVTRFNRTHKDEVINPRFKIRQAGGFKPDLFEDEVLIALDTPRGVVVILGCSHPGMRNMIDTVKSLLNKPVYAVLGGTHLVEANKETQAVSLNYLGKDELKIVGVSHCTGPQAMSQLNEFNKNYYHNRTGSSIIID
ncbi:MAG: hypothetical protein B6241_02280 [Spirochaetaceae bacterium 4572_59]|nr:MAG: hypothetical protein B6241_02280 [Spirochaetaceae bacterium 4572_59]